MFPRAAQYLDDGAIHCGLDFLLLFPDEVIDKIPTLMTSHQKATNRDSPAHLAGYLDSPHLRLNETLPDTGFVYQVLCFPKLPSVRNQELDIFSTDIELCYPFFSQTIATTHVQYVLLLSLEGPLTMECFVVV